MKKAFLLILIALILTGCKSHNEEYYIKVADTAVSFYRQDTYDTTQFYEEDLNALNQYLSRITHHNQIIELENYMIKGDLTDENDSPEVFIKDGKCAIKYEDLYRKFQSSIKDVEIEPYFRGICNGNYFTIYESSLYPKYDITKTDPKYDYVLLKDKKEKNAYTFYYRSTYDGSGLKITLTLDKKKVVNIKEEFVNVDYDVHKED